MSPLLAVHQCASAIPQQHQVFLGPFATICLLDFEPVLSKDLTNEQLELLSFQAQRTSHGGILARLPIRLSP
jgi:hypothetical protein